MSLPLNPLHPRSIAARIAARLAPVPVMDRSAAAVLALHGVTSGTPVHLNTRFVSAARLRGDIRALRQIPGLRFVTLAEAMDPDCPGPKVALTFDDGLRCLFHTLLPLLEAESVPACLFITTLDAHDPALIRRRCLWADRLDVAAHKGHAPFVIGDETFRLDARRIWRRAVDGAELKALCLQRDRAFLDAIAAACDLGDGMEDYWELLTTDQLRTLAAHPLIELGSHGVTHANLPSLTTGDKHIELTASKAWMEDCVQREVTAFAYPHGHYDAECLSLARSAGYRVQALMDYHSAKDAAAPDLCRRIGNHPRCGSLVQRRVIAAGGYGHEVFT